MQQSDFETRVRFLAELAKRLHQYGTSTVRLESAIDKVADRLALRCNSLATPTSIILSFAMRDEGPDALPRSTQVIRLDPGEVNLRRLCETDAIAEQVYRGQMDIQAGLDALKAVRTGLSPRAEWLKVFSFGISSSSVAVLMKGVLADVVVAFFLGLAIGLLSRLAQRKPDLGPSFEALAALVAMLAAAAIATFVVPIHTDSVLIASLIVLLPGLTLTTAVAELSTQHLVAGSVRFMGATATLLKLTFGTVAATQVAQLLQWKSMTVTAAPLPAWSEWLALLAASYAFAVLFQAQRRDYLICMAASWLGYLCTRFAGAWSGPEFGAFFAGLVVGSAANLYARWQNRPGAVVRVPGIILLVPGTVGLGSWLYVFDRDVYLGLDKAFSLIVILACLVAGLLFGNLLISPRRSL
jgi:uncharacterized membrane protein YjjP (DUF1212 family)